jgi:TRAP-type C4-dicarboxylate transport system substrate-binding protein
MTRSALIPTLLAATLAAGCGGSGGDQTNKAGAPVEGKRQVVTLQATDAGSDEAQHLARQIEKRSGGTLEVRVEPDYDSRDPANEVRLAKAVRAGDADFAILPARAWAQAGVPGFAALQAPFVLGSHDVAREAVAGRAGELLADQLRNAGVEPLGLVPTQLRRLLATRALTAPQRFDGARLRIVDNDTTAAVIESLGGDPRQGLQSNEVLPALEKGDLDGAESAPSPILDNGYGSAAKHLTGYALFDRVDTVVASPDALKRLSAGQREAIRAAAADTARFAATQAAREDADLVKLCRQGVRVDVPSAASLRALAAATAPVRAALARDGVTAEVLRHLSATPGAGPQALAAPAECTGGQRKAAPKAAAQAPFPEGRYVVTLTKADYRRFEEFGSDFQRTLKSTHVFRDGRVVYTVSPEWGPKEDRCPCTGTYEVDGDRLVIDWERADWPSETSQWSYYGGKLTFTSTDAGGQSDQALYLAHPWRRAG